MIMKLGMEHVYIHVNDDPGLTLAYFTARSNLLLMHLNGENVNGENLQQMIKRTEDLCF